MFSLLFVTVLAVAAQSREMPPWVKQHGSKQVRYYKDPDPKVVLPMLDDLLLDENLKHGFFVSRTDVWTTVSSAIGDMAAGQPEIVREIEKRFDLALEQKSDRAQLAIAMALRNCGDSQSLESIESWMEEDLRKDIVSLLNETKKFVANEPRGHFRDALPTTPNDLDMLWSNFFVTGEFEPAGRILDLFDQDAQQVKPIVLRAAQWSFESNLRQHSRLQQLLRENLANRPPASAALAKKLLDKVNPGEFPTGTYVGSVQKDWSLRFTKDKRYQVIRGGKPVVDGIYSIKGDVVMIIDKSGPLAVKEEAQKAGQYRWQKQGTSIRLIRLADRAQGRAAVISSNVWHREGIPQP